MSLTSGWTTIPFFTAVQINFRLRSPPDGQRIDTRVQDFNDFFEKEELTKLSECECSAGWENLLSDLPEIRYCKDHLDLITRIELLLNAYSDGISPVLLGRVMNLPKEVRHLIYGYLFKGFATKVHPTSSSKYAVGAVAGAAISFKSARCAAKKAQSDGEQASAPVRSILERKKDQSRFLPDGVYSHLVKFVLVLEEVELKQLDFCGEERLDRIQALGRSELGILEDFLAWFLQETIVELDATATKIGVLNPRARAEAGLPVREPLSTSWLRKHPNLQHCNIVNLSLVFITGKPKMSRSAKGYDFDEYDTISFGKDTTGKSFAKMCGLIALRMPHLKYIILWLSLPEAEFEDLYAHPEKHVWVDAFRSIHVAERFEAELEIALPLENTTVQTVGEISKKRDLVREILMPDSLRDIFSGSTEGMGFEGLDLNGS